MSDLPVPITRDVVRGMLGALERSGPWIAAEKILARALMGEVTLDFRDAELPSDGIVEVRCDALMGQIDLIVPPDAEIRLEGVRCMFGEVRQRGERPRVRSIVRRMITGEPEGDSPVSAEGEPLLLVVTGRCLLGAVYVTVRPPE